jgi:hypothetical protein
MGKCNTYDTEIKKGLYKVKIGDLIQLTLKERIIAWLERKMVDAARKPSGISFLNFPVPGFIAPPFP